MKKLKLIFITTIIATMLIASSANSSAIGFYPTEIDKHGNVIAFDLYHGGYHSNDIKNLAHNFTAADNLVTYINQTWELPDEVDVLFLTEADAGAEWLPTQVTDIVNWMALGGKLLWVAGDSDYAGLFNPTPINDILSALGAITRMDKTSISDAVYNDGASYRVAATQMGIGDPMYDGELIGDLSVNMVAGIICHGPCSIVGYNGTEYVDLRLGHSVFPDRLWTIMRYSENATADDSDVSDGPLDLYAYSAESGNYPAVVYEYLDTVNSHIVASGEAIYSNYKYMYDQRTENGVYNGGHQFGQILVNNILNYIMVSHEEPTPTETETELTSPTSKTVDIGIASAIVSIAVTTIYILKRTKKKV